MSRSAFVIPVALPGGMVRSRTACSTISSDRRLDLRARLEADAVRGGRARVTFGAALLDDPLDPGEGQADPVIVAPKETRSWRPWRLFPANRALLEPPWRLHQSSKSSDRRPRSRGERLRPRWPLGSPAAGREKKREEGIGRTQRPIVQK